MTPEVASAAATPQESSRLPMRGLLEWSWGALAWLAHAAALALPMTGLAWTFTAAGPLGAALALPLALFAYLVCLLLICGLLRISLPRIVDGSYEGLGSRQQRIWTLHYGLLNVVRLPGLERLIRANPLSRRLYYRAFGARVHPAANVSYEATLVDPSRVEIAADAQVGAFARIGGHFADPHRFVIATTRIGKGALVGVDALIGPGVTIGAGAFVAPRSSVLPFSEIGDRELWVGSPARCIGEVDDLP